MTGRRIHFDDMDKLSLFNNIGKYTLGCAIDGGKVVSIEMGDASTMLGFRDFCVSRECDFELYDISWVIDNHGQRPMSDAHKTGKGDAWQKNVKCVETGKVYRCLSDLVREIEGKGRWAIDSAIRANKSINGLHYEYVKEKY